YGIGDHQIAKIDMARQQSLQGLTYAYKAGCKIGSGSDLLGDMMTQRAVEFELKGQVMTPMEVLLSATKVNAELFRMQDRVASGPGILGCGFAMVARHVTGIDLTPAMLERARLLQAEQGLTNLTWRQGDVLPLPFADAAFTLVVSRFAFQHLIDPGAVLAEM